MATPDTSAAKPDVQTPNADGLNNETRDALRNDEREAPAAPKMSGATSAGPNPLSTPADLREAGMPQEPMSTESDEPRTGRSD